MKLSRVKRWVAPLEPYLATCLDDECGWIIERARSTAMFFDGCKAHVRESGHAVAASASCEVFFEPASDDAARAADILARGKAIGDARRAERAARKASETPTAS